MTSTRMPGRTRHAMISDGNGNLYVFGGHAYTGSPLGDLWRLSLQPSAWTTRGDEFSIRWDPVLAPGQDDVNTGARQEILHVRGDLPTARSGHTLTLLDGSRALLYGGFTDAGIAPGNEYYVLDFSRPDDLLWIRQETAGDASPGGREGHAALRLGPDSVVVIGGCDTTSTVEMCHGDAWQLQISSGQWTQLSAAATAPRMDFAAVSFGEQVLITGGTRAGWSISATAHMFNITAGSAGATPPVCPATVHGPLCDLPSFLGSEVPGVCNDCGLLSPTGRCECYLGYSGPSCEFGANKCLNGCSGNGYCNSQSQCECDTGWSGLDCSIANRCPSQCCGNGMCLKDVCLCNEGFYGILCAVSGDKVQALKQELQSRWDEFQDLSGKLNAAIEQSKLRKNEATGLEQQAEEEELQAQLNALLLSAASTFLAADRSLSDEELIGKYFSNSCQGTQVALPTLEEEREQLLAETRGQVSQGEFVATGSTSYEQVPELWNRTMELAAQNMRNAQLQWNAENHEDLLSSATEGAQAATSALESKLQAGQVVLNEAFGVESQATMANASLGRKCFCFLTLLLTATSSVMIIHLFNQSQKRAVLSAGSLNSIS